MQLERGIPLAPMTTLGLGGPATELVTVTRESDVVEAVKAARAKDLRVFVLGGGSNVVVADEGVDALVIKMALCGTRTESVGDRVHVTLAAGETWDAFVERAVHERLAGVECLSGIPGLMGATPIQNVGAYGQEVKDTIVSVRVYDRSTQAFETLTPRECAFGYRTSRLKRAPQFIVTDVTFALRRGEQSEPIRYPELSRALGVKEGEAAPVARVRDAVIALRRAKGMVVDPADTESRSVGSFFINPVIDGATLGAIERRAREMAAPSVPRYPAGDECWKVPAAWLIEQAGFHRGFGAGKVRVSARHTLALVHVGGGTTNELLTLARAIVRGVDERFGIKLTPEPVLVGCAL